MIGKRQAKLLGALVIGAALALNFPALTIVEALQAATGPVGEPIYVFGVWAVAILAAALILERQG